MAGSTWSRRAGSAAIFQLTTGCLSAPRGRPLASGLSLQPLGSAGRMSTTQQLTEVDLLDEWMTRRSKSSRTVPERLCRRGMRFAFYGRTSTIGHQDAVSSRGWQREAAESVIAGHGAIVAEFFDAGCSRRVPWSSRPDAAALLAEVPSDERRFDAVVVGEYERAFSGDQFVRMSAMLRCFGVQIWLPEGGGPVDLDDPMHQALVAVLGAQSQREVLRSRHRVLAAMRAQAREQGRYLGGRPPYGYRLVDAGPHPNRTHAGGGVGCSAWTRIRRRRRTSGGCSRSGWLATVWPASPESSPNAVCRLRRRRIRSGTATVQVGRGGFARSQ